MSLDDSLVAGGKTDGILCCPGGGRTCYRNDTEAVLGNALFVVGQIPTREAIERTTRRSGSRKAIADRTDGDPTVATSRNRELKWMRYCSSSASRASVSSLAHVVME
jgi:hypothetical protein